MEKRINYSEIKGWGIDADPQNDPTYPIKHRTDEEQKGYTWERPVQQVADTEILHSNERPNLSAVFGTVSPPKGLSGMIRRFAFRYSENSYLHWLPLVLADRVNAFEGIVEDMIHGRFPNFIAEKGMKAKWKFDRSAVWKQLAIGGIFATLAGAFFYSKSDWRPRVLLS
ncbi:MAG: hypothetical protein ACJ75J_17045 [Cytophagaceae bacterium]